MTHTENKGALSGFAARVLGKSHFIAIALIASFMSLAATSARAQSSDTWKSVAIIGGSSAAGAYIGHKVAGRSGTWIGAAGGAAVGYAIDKHRRNNQYYNQAYGNNGYYGPNGGYYGNGNDGYYGPSGYAPAPYNGPYYSTGYRGSQYQSGDSGNGYQRGFTPRCRR
jgi:hypothetical protein